MSAAETTPDRVHVALDARGYDILVGHGLLCAAGRHMGPLLHQPRVVVVTDEAVAGLHLATLEAGLDGSGIAHDRIILEPGERTKDFPHLERLVDDLLALRVERGTAILALGGGVVGDLAGFAASILLRGVDLIQAPTTLLAQVDSSVGGKTGINTQQGKNLVGSFHQPRLVLADTAALDTLPRRALQAGYAEVVKYGLIDDAGFFDWCEENGRRLIDGDVEARRYAVKASCAAKARIVAEDEREAGRRALLNLGHTFGHALEADAGYGDTLLHGEAVAAGMVLAFELSHRLGLCPAEDAVRVRRHLGAVGLPAGLGALAGVSGCADRLIEHMRHDQKVRDGRPTFVLARGIGQAFLASDVPLETVRGLLETAVAA